MESAAPQTPVQALEALQNAYSRFLDALPEARRASLGEAIGFFLRSDGNPKLGSLVDAFAEELPVHVEALKTRLAACPAEEADRLAHRVGIIDAGRLIAEGTPDALQDRVGRSSLVPTPATPEDPAPPAPITTRATAHPPAPVTPAQLEELSIQVVEHSEEE